MNWGLLALLLLIAAAIAVQNLWLRRRAESGDEGESGKERDRS